MARRWSEMRAQLVADGRLDEHRVAASKAELLARLHAIEGAQVRGGRGPRATARSSPGANNGGTAPESLVTIIAPVMEDPRASKLQKSLAASALALQDGSRETLAEVERKAAIVLRGGRYSEVTRKLAAAVIEKAGEHG